MSQPTLTAADAVLIHRAIYEHRATVATGLGLLTLNNTKVSAGHARP